MKVTILSAIVTIAGIIFLVLCLAIIFLGKKVGEQNGGRQKIKVGNIEVNTNSVITLVLIAACIIIAPLGFAYWKPQLSDYVAKEEISEKYLSLKDLSVVIHGAVILEDGQFADRVNIEIVRQYKDTADTLRDMSGEQGDFYVELENAKPKEKYSITWTKPGYARKTLRFGFNEIPFPIVLSKQGGN